VIALAIIAAGARTADSLPLFTRRLGLPCAHCHSAPPALNAVGLAFAQNGYRLPNTEQPRTRAVPLSVVGHAALEIEHRRFATRAPSAPELLSDNDLRLRSDGVIARKISYRMDVGRRDPNEPTTALGFAQLDDIVPRGALNLRVGHFAAQPTPLAQTQHEMLAEDLTPTSFESRGVELNGQRNAWEYAAGASLSDRHYKGGVRPGPISPPLEDSYARLERQVGTHAVAVQFALDRQDSHLPTLSWLQHMRAQIAGSFGTPRFTLIPAYVFDRFDDRPSPGLHERHEYYRIEAPTLLDARGRWDLTGRFEYENRAGNRFNPQADRQLEALDLVWQPSPNERVGAEWARAAGNGLGPSRIELDAFVQAMW